MGRGEAAHRTDANTAILYAPCYGRPRDLTATFLFTLKFDDAGKWKIIKMHQVSKKELDETMRSLITFVACTIGSCFSNTQEILLKGEHRD